jgi:nitroreductase
VDALEALLSRRSIPAQCLVGPGPDDAQLAAALDAAVRAPDHGRLQPWRFRLVRGAARARLGDLLVETTIAREPATPHAQLEKLRQRPLHAALVVVASALLRDHPKVPEIEQLLSVGAAAMNLLNAFHAQGFGAAWLTGPSAYDPEVARRLGLDAAERLVGFLYVGSVGTVVPAAPARPASRGFVTEWQGPAP